jgi:hypothetical protein
MKEKYDSCKYPGKYEGESPMVQFIMENDLFDATDGDVEAPCGWFGRAGKWAIGENSQGFASGYKYPTTWEADDWYASQENYYNGWLSEEED